MLLKKKVRNKQTYPNFNLSSDNVDVYMIGSVKNNPILIDGDIIYIINGLIKRSFDLITQITRPIVNFSHL